MITFKNVKLISVDLVEIDFTGRKNSAPILVEIPKTATPKGS